MKSMFLDFQKLMILNASFEISSKLNDAKQNHTPRTNPDTHKILRY